MGVCERSKKGETRKRREGRGVSGEVRKWEKYSRSKLIERVQKRRGGSEKDIRQHNQRTEEEWERMLVIKLRENKKLLCREVNKVKKKRLKIIRVRL